MFAIQQYLPNLYLVLLYQHRPIWGWRLYFVLCINTRISVEIVRRDKSSQHNISKLFVGTYTYIFESK